jgi:hypothetical protein
MTLLAASKVIGVQWAEWQAGVPIASAPLTVTTRRAATRTCQPLAGAQDIGLNFGFREEFRTPFGVRKSPKNEPAVWV